MNVVLPLVTLMLAAAGTFSVQAVMQGQPGVPVCGGVGSDERETLARHAKGANVALEFFIAGRGNYVADVDVRLTPEAHPERSLAMTTDGPICFLHVPPGRYRVEAAYNGHARKVVATIPEAAAQPVKVAIGFPEQKENR